MLPKAYDPKAVEDRIYKMWEESGAFKADSSSDKEPFTISMPPPNATGQLHLGHAARNTVEDIFTRFNRMKGKEALWLPGTDHAAIATESVVIRKIQEEGIKDPRVELGREKLVERVREYVENSRGTIRSQTKKMGTSCDWSRERYTMDPSLNRCVNEVFKKMYDDGLIYRGHRIVNWDPKMQTTVADDEVEYTERKEPYWTFQYGPFQISTSRPETKFGDKYVVVHPDDPRYEKYKNGEIFECEWINGKITATVIKDAEIIDMEQGTGCMTVTPWHDKADFDLAERHGLEKEQIIDYDGKLLPIAGDLAGMHIEDARPKVVEILKKKGLLVETKEEYVHNVALSYRGKGMIEPQIMEQWFVDVNKQVVGWRGKKMSLKEIMQDTVRSGDIRIIPERFEKTYFHWVDNLWDWCISRQIWWGHRIPVWYRGEGKDRVTYVGITAPEGDDWEQDQDTLDTWFSSALWTWSTLIDPKLAEDKSLSLKEILDKSPDFKKFHPTQVMETAYEILFFWVARMILMTTYATGQIPFHTVYLAGLIRTRDGRKMSKSDPETMIDPLDIIDRYGADSLRLSLIVGQSPGNDTRMYEDRIVGYRNFVNKLWNASRFVLMKCEDEGVDVHGVSGSGIRNPESGPSSSSGRNPESGGMSLADRALQSSLEKLIQDVTEGLNDYRLSEVGERLYSFIWDYFCDWYLELSKGETNINMLVGAMRTFLVLLHPYCPFVTEELWEQFKYEKSEGMLINQPWPVHSDPGRSDPEAEEQFQMIIDVISAIRRVRSEYNINQGKKIDVTLVSKSESLLKEQEENIKRLGRVGDLAIQSGKFDGAHAASVFTKDVEVHVPLEGVIDVEKEKGRLAKEKAQLEKFLEGVQGKLKNKKFMESAPEEVVTKERQKEEDATEKLKKINERISTLS